jgi:hypothetical protein
MSDERWTMTRREMLGASAAALVLPLLSARPLAALTERAFAARFFTPAEFAMVDELSDMIIPTDEVSPGARAARVAGEIDRRLADSLDTKQQQQWRDGLRAVNDLAREMTGGKTLMQATADQRLEVLTHMASLVDETPGARRARRADPKSALGGFFRQLKSATARAYYTSKIGIHQDQHYKGNVYQTGEYAGFDPT